MAALGQDVPDDGLAKEVEKMPMWGGYWGGPWAGFGWIFPLFGLLFMVVMIFMCFRMMGGMMRGGSMPGHAGPGTGEIEELRREVRELKEEIRKLRERS
jgi:hypothetical protein